MSGLNAASIAENLSQYALPTAVVGMGTVFAVLIILWGVLELFRVIFYEIPKRKAAAAPAAPAAAAPAAAAPAAAAIPDPITDADEFVALATAAVATYADIPVDTVKVTGIRRV